MHESHDRKIETEYLMTDAKKKKQEKRNIYLKALLSSASLKLE
jgi:hypothetical protein